jgi:hypothetical protein
MAEMNAYVLSDGFFKTLAHHDDVLVTPEIAAEWLQRNHHKNRNLRQYACERYARLMRNGRWVKNGATIKFTRSGVLIDGQHRLAAVCLTRTSALFDVQCGLDDDAIHTLGDELSRTRRDAFTIADVPHPEIAAPVARLWYLYKNGRLDQSNQHNLGNLILATEEHLEEYREIERLFGRDLIATAMAYSIAVSSRGRDRPQIFAHKAAPALLFFIAYAMGPIDKAAQFLRSIKIGVTAFQDDASVVLRNRLMANAQMPVKLRRLSRAGEIGVSLKAWLRYRANIGVKRLDPPRPAEHVPGWSEKPHPMWGI